MSKKERFVKLGNKLSVDWDRVKKACQHLSGRAGFSINGIVRATVPGYEV